MEEQNSERMANEVPQPPPSQAETKLSPAMPIAAAVAGWVIPGLGHALLRQWPKALAYFFAVTLLGVTGLLLRGNIFSYPGGDAFDKLGFLADIGTGVLYFLANVIDRGGPDVSHAAGDYGTRLFATAGVLNLLCVLEAYHIAKRRSTMDSNP